MQNIIKRGLVVSCQALPEEPLHSSFIMGKMAFAAQSSGAVAIRANSVSDITEIKTQVSIPVIGIIKINYENMIPYITPTMKEVDALVAIKTDVIAMDATINQDIEFLKQVRQKYPNHLFMADISTLSEGLCADELGFNFIGTTLVGYTQQSKGVDKFDVLKELIAKCKNLVIAEGNFSTPQSAASAIQLGAHAVVVGGAITRPQLITKTFTQAIDEVL